MKKNNENCISKAQEPCVSDTPQKDTRVEFAERFDLFMTQFRSVCENENVPIAIAIVVDPKSPKTPFIYSHGHVYDQASLLAKVLRDLKHQIVDEISA